MLDEKPFSRAGREALLMSFVGEKRSEPKEIARVEKRNRKNDTKQ